MEKSYLQNRQFWLMSFSAFLFFISYSMILPELPDFLKEIGGKDINPGYIMFFFSTFTVIARPISGKLTDTIGRIPIMVLGAALACVSSISYPIWTTVFGFLFLRCIHGLAVGFKPTATAAYLSDIASDNRRGEVMGFMGVVASTALGIGPVIGSFIRGLAGFNAMFITSGCISLLSVIIFAGLKETLPEKKRRKISLKLFNIKVKDVFEPRVLMPSLTFLFNALPFGVIMTVIPDFEKSLGIENKGLFFLYVLLSAIFSTILAGKLSDRYGRLIVIKCGMTLLIISVIMIGSSMTAHFLYLGGIVYGIARGTFTSTTYAWVADLSNPDSRGRAFSTMFILYGTGIALGGFISGYYYNNVLENIPFVFYGAAVTTLFALTSLTVYGLVKRQKV